MIIIINGSLGVGKSILKIISTMSTATEDIVYTYDGKKGECIDNMTLGWCIEQSP